MLQGDGTQRQRTSYITPSEEHRLNPMIRDAGSILFRISSEEALLKKRHRAENRTRRTAIGGSVWQQNFLGRGDSRTPKVGMNPCGG